MKGYIVKYENAICCEACKAQSIEDGASEADFRGIPASEVLDSIYNKSDDTALCCYCDHDFDADGSQIGKVRADAQAIAETYRELDSWLNSQRG